MISPTVYKWLFAFSLVFLTSPSVAKDISIKAKPVEVFQTSSPDRIKFGQLEFISGLELASKNNNFGGLSGLRIVNDTLYAVTDKGHFLTASIIRKEGKLSGLDKATLTRLRDRDGKKLKGKKEADAEALEISGSQFLVGFERKHRIEAFNLKDNKLIADKRAKPIRLKKFKLPNNKGPEAIARMPNSNRLLAFAEYAPNDENLHQAFMIEGETITPFFVTLTPGYSLTDAAFLPSGELLMLERFYTPITGAAMRMRTFDVNNIAANMVLDGKTIMQATSEMQIDNMEGLAITRDETGGIRITLISDDNFARNQRTLLLEFKLID